jgi:hypothetical protein
MMKHDEALRSETAKMFSAAAKAYLRAAGLAGDGTKRTEHGN